MTALASLKRSLELVRTDTSGARTTGATELRHVVSKHDSSACAPERTPAQHHSAPVMSCMEQPSAPCRVRPPSVVGKLDYGNGITTRQIWQACSTSSLAYSFFFLSAGHRSDPQALRPPFPHLVFVLTLACNRTRKGATPARARMLTFSFSQSLSYCVCVCSHLCGWLDLSAVARRSPSCFLACRIAAGLRHGRPFSLCKTHADTPVCA